MGISGKDLILETLVDHTAIKVAIRHSIRVVETTLDLQQIFKGEERV